MAEELTFKDFLKKPIGELKSVGQGLSESFKNIGISNLAELLRFYPSRYLDRTAVATINTAEDDETTILAKVLKVGTPFKSKRKKIWVVKVDMADIDGKKFDVMFFNQPWRAKQLEEEMEVAIYGKIKIDKKSGKAQISHPVVDMVGDQTERILPVYSLPKFEKIYPPRMGRAVAETLRRSQDRGIYDPVSKIILKELNLLSRFDALKGIHIPENFEDVFLAKKRLAFDELLAIQLVLLERREKLKKIKGLRHDIDFKLANEFINSLPYELTSAQKKAISEIQNDLSQETPMHRLLQGDVGSGKTIVALAAVLCVVEAGHQAAFLVPTEVLAEQHYKVIKDFLSNLSFKVPDKDGLLSERDLSVELLTNQVTVKRREELLPELKQGKIDLLVGTSALIYEGVDFKSLGLTVIDEQHRFGVNQRALLREKSTLKKSTSKNGKSEKQKPEGKQLTDEQLLDEESRADVVSDSLAMTATPIPRTVALTVYGDLDISILDEMPAGRLPVKTELVTTKNSLSEVWEHVRKQVSNGHQAYVVCPLIDGGQNTEEGIMYEEGMYEEGFNFEGADFEKTQNGKNQNSNMIEKEASTEYEISQGEISLGFNFDDIDGSDDIENDNIENDNIEKAQKNKATKDTSSKTSHLGATIEDFSVVNVYDKLSSDELKGLRVEVLHGRLPADEKNETMSRFNAGNIDVLICTTVIEVGIDVKNATMMVIMGAFRFGIAQLHQLRGRVGRSDIQSYCYLVSNSETDRLLAVESSNNGFELAEADLALRREGTILGNRQTGRGDLRAARLSNEAHRALVQPARKYGEEILKAGELSDKWDEEIKFLLGIKERTDYLTKS